MILLEEPSHGFYFASVLYRQDLITKEKILNFWSERFSEGQIFEIDYTHLFDYYQNEMGDKDKLARFFIFSTKDLRPRDQFAPLKVWAQEFEKQTLQAQGELRRAVNVDIGLLTLENMLLATSKNFGHRVYLSDGVFADLNLIYRQKSYRPLEWTYPEYKRPDMIDKFNSLRAVLFQSLKS
jgi:hypothetical protein